MNKNAGAVVPVVLGLLGQPVVPANHIPVAVQVRPRIERTASIDWVGPLTTGGGLCRLGDDAPGRFRACHRGPLQLRSFLQDPRTGQREELGGASGRVALLAQAPVQGSHRMLFDFAVSDLQVRSGYIGGSMTVEVGCAGAGCSRTTPVTKPLATWQAQPTASYDFTGALGTKAPEFAAGGNFFLRVTINSSVDTNSADSLSDSFRCDNATYLRRKDGCVLDSFSPTITFERSDPEYGAVADHIHQALADPGSTRPAQPGKRIPAMLHRRYPANPRDNATYVASLCRKDFPQEYRPPQTQCDEYPFNASRERPQPTGPKNFSVRPVPARQNEAAGRHLNNFYADNRVLDGDPNEVAAAP